MFSVFIREKVTITENIAFSKLFVHNPASGLLQIDQKSKKWQWRHNFPTWRHCQMFLTLFCFSCFSFFSYWSKFHVNIITGSGIMTIFFYKELTRNPKIGNTSVWVFPDIWWMRQVMDTRFSTNVSNRMLLKSAKFQSYSFYCFWVIKGKSTGG